MLIFLVHHHPFAVVSYNRLRCESVCGYTSLRYIQRLPSWMKDTISAIVLLRIWRSLFSYFILNFEALDFFPESLIILEGNGFRVGSFDRR